MFAIKINNIPEYAALHPFTVAQFDEDTGSFWFYGAYDSLDKAQAAASSEYCHNGVVCYRV